MKIISVFNQKGGVGKTTTNINLAAYLAINGHKVLIIDIDPQGNSTSGLGIDKKKVEASSYHLLTDNVSLDEAMIKSELIENLYIVPSTIELAGAEIEMIDIKGREKILKEKIKSNNKQFEYIFIDCPPSLGLLTLNALSASTSVLIPIQCEYYALEGVSQLVNTIQLVKKSLNKKLMVEGVILTMFDNRTKLCNEVSIEVKKYFGDKVFDATIPRNVRLAEAPSFGLPIMLYDDKCKGAESYEELTKEFIKRQEVK